MLRYCCSAGSSPRERGEGLRPHGRRRVRRFIPARTGRGSPAPSAPSPSAVHPRANGERVCFRSRRSASTGSSPRERGEAHNRGPVAELGRFIPARTGRGLCYWFSACRESVHPRANGEREKSLPSLLMAPGSSPRERGEGLITPGVRSDARFIPARTGRGRMRQAWKPETAVHPRANGERGAVDELPGIRDGSSPRERGEGSRRFVRAADDRFIPARTGRGGVSPSMRSRISVHPRANGERLSDESERGSGSGSSPRERGEVEHVGVLGQEHRFIPARTGRGPASAAAPAPPPVHPRANGERPSPAPSTPSSGGSSPRERGEDRLRPRRSGAVRFIPARTGRGSASSAASRRPAVHPRANGERSADFRTADIGNGSSPRERGEDEGVERGVGPRRFIPARTGRGRCKPARSARSSVHPRANGERSTN